MWVGGKIFFSSKDVIRLHPLKKKHSSIIFFYELTGTAIFLSLAR